MQMLDAAYLLLASRKARVQKKEITECNSPSLVESSLYMYTHIHGAGLDFRNGVIHQAFHNASRHPKGKEEAFSFARQLKFPITVPLSLLAL